MCSTRRGCIVFIAKSYSMVWPDHIVFTCSAADGRLGGFRVLAMVSNASASAGCRFLCFHFLTWVIQSFCVTLRRVNFQRAGTTLHSHQQGLSTPVAPHSFPDTSTCHCVSDLSYSNRQRFGFFISLMTNDVGHLFMYLPVFVSQLWGNALERSEPLPIFK